MGFSVGDRVEVNYSVDDFPGHVGIVRDIKESTLLPGKTIVISYWPFLDKEIAFFEESLDLVWYALAQKKYPFRGSGNTCQLHFTTTQGGETSEA
jgi:hypothetical protein